MDLFQILSFTITTSHLDLVSRWTMQMSPRQCSLRIVNIWVSLHSTNYFFVEEKIAQ